MNIACVIARRLVPAMAVAMLFASRPVAAPDSTQARLPTISVSQAERAAMKDQLLVTGSFIAREEVLVSPEIDGLAIVDIRAEEGDRVEAGQILARLNDEMLRVQLAQNAAQIARADAAIDNARAQIAEADANREQASAALERAKSLRGSGTITTDVFEQRIATAKVSEARANAARQSLGLAEADRALVEKQRAEIQLRLARCDIRAPVAGIISRRTAKVGQVASGIATSEPLFRLVARGDIDLEADIPEASFARLKVGQPVTIDVLGHDDAITGFVRLIAPEMNRSTRLGRVRIAIPANSPVALGAFGRGIVLIAERNALVVPLSAVSFGGEDASVQVVSEGVVGTRRVETGMRSGGRIEITSGIGDGEAVVSVAGTFVRDGDHVRPVPYVAAR
ncbi:MAG: efflux RND transporter periplasmic adaptor subunit [Hyphomicrobiales bacterium]|nr:efflux RND transporter periplasmic adaptor subunit [Hyphomicrobiales bacterium]